MYRYQPQTITYPELVFYAKVSKCQLSLLSHSVFRTHFEKNTNKPQYLYKYVFYFRSEEKNTSTYNWRHGNNLRTTLNNIYLNKINCRILQKPLKLSNMLTEYLIFSNKLRTYLIMSCISPSYNIWSHIFYCSTEGICSLVLGKKIKLTSNNYIIQIIWDRYG